MKETPCGATARGERRRPARVLLVENDPRILGASGLILRRHGCLVATAENGLEGWNSLQSRHFDLLITENEMPKMSGLELARATRDSGRKLPIIIVSDSSQIGLARGDFAARLPKPFTSQMLLDAVDSALKTANSAPAPGALPLPKAAELWRRIAPHPHGGINE